jgi:hypothetical protein
MLNLFIDLAKFFNKKALQAKKAVKHHAGQKVCGLHPF